MRYIKTYEDLVHRTFMHDKIIFFVDETDIVNIFIQALLDAIRDVKTFVVTGDYANIYIRDRFGKMKRFFQSTNSRIEDRGGLPTTIRDYVFYYNGKKYDITGKLCAELRNILIRYVGLYYREDSYEYMPAHFEHLGRTGFLSSKDQVDNFWIEAAGKLGKSVVVNYLTTIGKKTQTGYPLIVRDYSKNERKVLLPKTALMVIEEEPTMFQELKRYMTKAFIEKLPNHLKRGDRSGMWGLKTESVEEKPSEKELFLQYYSDLYLRKNYDESTIYKAYIDDFIDKEDAIELMEELTENYKKDDYQRMSDYYCIRLYQEGIFTEDQLILKMDDLMKYKGELKWKVDEFKDLPGTDSDSVLIKVLDGEDLGFEWTSWYNYSTADIWQYIDEEFEKKILEYCYNKEFEYEGEDYVMKPEMVSWAPKYRQGGEQRAYVQVGEEKVTLEDLIEEFEGIYDAMNRAMNYAYDNAMASDYYSEAKKIIKSNFGDYEEVKLDKYYVKLFDANRLGEIADYIENNIDDLMNYEYSTYGGLLSSTLYEDEKVDYDYGYREGNVYPTVDDKDVQDEIIEMFEQEGIEKE